MTTKGQNYLKGAAVLGIAGIIVKILGAVYRIPLSNIIKDEGIGYYQTAYPIYVLLLALSTAGIPVAIAKLVSERRALGDYRNAHKIFKVSLTALTGLGIITSMIIAFGANWIVQRIGNPDAYYALIALAPALLFVPIMSAFRGFFQGSQTMVPTALSQVLEQLFRVGTGLFLTVVLLNKGLPIAAGGASFGGSVGAFVGAATIIIVYFKRRFDINKEINSSLDTPEYTADRIIRDLLLIAVPITIGSTIAPVMDTIDAALVFRRLQDIGYSAKTANDLYGQLKGMAQTLVNLPQVFSIAISMSLVPAISTASARRSKKELSEIISSGIRMTLLIGLPSALGLFVLAKPLIALLYFNNEPSVIASTGDILTYLSLGVVFLTLVQALTAILQGLGKTIIPVRNLFIGAVAKVILTYVLTGIPAINVKGAAISTVTAYMIASSLDFYYVIKIANANLNLRKILIKPLASSIGMAVTARLSFHVLAVATSDKLATLGAVGVGVIVYGILLLATGTITQEDLAMITKSERASKFLAKFGRK